MSRAIQHGENSRTVFAAWTLRQKTRRALSEATPPQPAIHAAHSPASQCTAVPLPPCFRDSVPPPSRAKRNRTSNSNTAANRNRRNSLKTKPRQISNSNKKRHVAFTDFPPRVTSHPFLLGTRMQAESGASYRNQRVEPLSTRYTKDLPLASRFHVPGSGCFSVSPVTSHKSRITSHAFSPSPNAILVASAERGGSGAGVGRIQDWAGHRRHTGAEKRIGA